MKRTIILTLFSLILTAAMVCASPLSSFAEMAYNGYSAPDVSGTSGLYDTFSIDFRSKDTPYYTYWALANFNLYLSNETKRVYRNISGGGAYAGLQDKGPSYGHAGIMSFWEMRYRDKSQEVIMTATRVFPEGEGTFTGEGDGTNCIAPFDWKDDVWYRMVLHAWEDSETGTTFIGQWFQDRSTGEWTLFSYFDTHLYKSAIQGGVSFFQENYVNNATIDEVRTYNLKNTYVLDHEDKEWKSLPKSTLSYGDGGKANKVGQHDFGVDSDEDGEFFWGLTGGPVEDQAAYNAASKKSQTYTIDQPDKPSFGEMAKDTELKIADRDGEKELQWTYPSTGTPVLSYELDVVDAKGAVLFAKSETRPEVTSCLLEGVDTDAYRCTLNLTDVFGETVSVAYESEEFSKGGNDETPTPATEEPTEQTPAETPSEPAETPTSPDVETTDRPTEAPITPGTDDGKPSFPWPIVAGCCAGAAAVIAAVAIVISVKKKKKK